MVKLAIGVVTLIAVLILGVFYLNTISGSPDLNVKISDVKYPIKQGNITSTTLKVEIRNNGLSAITLDESIITSNFNGKELGRLEFNEPIIIKPREVYLDEIVLEEDWSVIQLSDNGRNTSYDFMAKVRKLFGVKIIELSNFAASDTSDEPSSEDEADTLLDEFVKNIKSGGPPKDGIPPIDNPKYITVQEADETIRDTEVIFLTESSDGVKIYPRRIMVWHEIVNEIIDGRKVSITYCPLTGSAIGYTLMVNDAQTDFGTSGKLVNSNLVMYDRASDSYWPQILGMAVKGDEKGKTLEWYPVVWTTWGLAKANYPDAQVLSEQTGFIRDYGRDPYGSYEDPNSYYLSGRPLMPVMNRDNRLQDKDVVIGVKNGNDVMALLKSRVKNEKIVRFELGGDSLVAVYDESLEAVLVNRQEMNEFDQLEPIIHFDVMWFSWVAYYPNTELYS